MIAYSRVDEFVNICADDIEKLWKLAFVNLNYYYFIRDYYFTSLPY